MKIVKQSVQLEHITPDAMKIIEAAGRVCYKSESSVTEDSADKFVAGIVKRQHLSVLEHVVASFRIITNRGILGELTRHRTGIAFSVQSSRYCDMVADKFGGEISFIEPFGLPEYSVSCFRHACEIAEQSYQLMRKDGCKPEQARDCLPMALATELVVTANFREWLHILDLRMAKGAHPQIRKLSMDIWKILNSYYPVIFSESLLPKEDINGIA